MRTLINLFPRPEKTASERLIFFGLHYLRHILVITQFVAICVFFFRFRVDQDIVDFKERLSQKDSIVSQTEPLVKAIEELDFKIKNTKQVLGEQTQLNSNYAYFFSKIPPVITLENVEIEGSSIQMEGSSLNADNIRNFYENVKGENRYETVTLSNIVRENEKFTFSISFEGFK